MVIYAIIRHNRKRNKLRKQSLGGATLVGEDEAAERRKGSDATYVSYEMDGELGMLILELPRTRADSS